MALKTFNIHADVYKEFSDHCKSNGISMSKKVENFIKEELKNLKSAAGVIEEEILDVESFEESHPLLKYC